MFLYIGEKRSVYINYAFCCKFFSSFFSFGFSSLSHSDSTVSPWVDELFLCLSIRGQKQFYITMAQNADGKRRSSSRFYNNCAKNIILWWCEHLQCHKQKLRKKNIFFTSTYIFMLLYCSFVTTIIFLHIASPSDVCKCNSHPRQGAKICNGCYVSCQFSVCLN